MDATCFSMSPAIPAIAASRGIDDERAPAESRVIAASRVAVAVDGIEVGFDMAESRFIADGRAIAESRVVDERVIAESRVIEVVRGAEAVRAMPESRVIDDVMGIADEGDWAE